MAEKTSFVFYLISNASMQDYPDNKPQHFRTHLETPLNLEGEWEVALSSIIYPHTWTQFKSDSYITYAYPVQNNARNEREYKRYKLTIKNQSSDKAENVVRAINDELNAQLEQMINAELGISVVPIEILSKYKRIEFALTDTYPQKLTLKKFWTDPNVKVTLPPSGDTARDLWLKLGVPNDVTTLSQNDVFKYPAMLNVHFPALYVYSPHIEFVALGDTRAPILAVVPTTSKEGQIAVYRVERPIYVRLEANRISDFEVYIKDDTGDEVLFTVGKTILTLHFRRRF